ncbi:PH domain-containing protein [Pseudomonas lundensis]|uniref:PH domain-containing protein n=1 Tax=Pseudomonas lundensis TaxID=86185 RepID=UPI001869283D|nr:PH domain-containing protein [Pseudomonas lundensis]
MADHRITAALNTLQRLLLDGESIIHSSSQVRLAALLHRRVIIATTPNRLIIFKRRLIGGYQMIDVRWQDLRDASIDENLLEKYFGAVFKAHVAGRGLQIVAGLEVDSARALYVFCQQQEQEWREKNRIRSIEEDRAKSGGMVLGHLGGHAPEAVSTTEEPLSRLKKAKTMLTEGLISDAEFETIKARIVNEL